jgi:hypothetical protein
LGKSARELGIQVMALRSESGQAFTEYLLLISIVALAYLAVLKGLTASGLAGKLVMPLKEDFARVYRYGHPKAKGYEDGGPEYLPVGKGKNSGRIFISPNQN